MNTKRLKKSIYVDEEIEMKVFTYKNMMIFRMILGLIVFQCQGMDQNGLKTVKNDHSKGFYPVSLSDFRKTGKSFGAGVMPYYEDEKGEKYVLLGREVNSRNKREWALFSGGSERDGRNRCLMEHPLDCAAREFYEEAILHKTLGWSEAEVKAYLKKNTTQVIARYSRDVKSSRPLIIYVVKFEKKQIEAIITTFKKVFNDAHLDEKFKEKDALALVKYQDLIDVVKKDEQRVALDKTLPYWFNKDEEDKILIYSMPYRLLRACYAPEEIFKVSGKEYHYVKDILPTDLQKQNYQFFAQEEVTKQICSKEVRKQIRSKI